MNGPTVKRWVNWIITLDRRIVYVFMFVAVTLPFFLKPVLKMKSTKWVRSSYELVEEAARMKKPIIIGFDYDPSTLAELQPMANAFLRHAFSKGIKVVGINFIPQGTSLAATTMDLVAKEYGKVYGEDYVFLGYLPQYYLVLLNFGEDFRKSYEADFRGTPINQVPMLKGLQNYDDFHLVICLSGSKLPDGYIIWGVSKFHFNFVSGVTAVSAAEYYPYLHADQMKGLLAGMKAAAEYETLIGEPGDAMRGMASQNWGHLTIIIFIIIGNILFYLKRRQDSREKGGF